MDEGEPNLTAKHTMNRHEVKSVVCLACQEEQPPSQACRKCEASFGAYFCSVCNLYDDDLTKKQFHCDKCGICRVGGRENFFHCDTCGACYAVELQNNHVCVPNSMQRECPICFEYLFDSLDAPQVRAEPPSPLPRHSSSTVASPLRANTHRQFACRIPASLRSFGVAIPSIANASKTTRNMAATRARYATHPCATCVRHGGISTARSPTLPCPRNTRTRACKCYAMIAMSKPTPHSMLSASNARPAVPITRGAPRVEASIDHGDEIFGPRPRQRLQGALSGRRAPLVNADAAERLSSDGLLFRQKLESLYRPSSLVSFFRA